MRKFTQVISIFIFGLLMFNLSACNKEPVNTNTVSNKFPSPSQNDVVATQLYAELQKAATEGNLEQVRTLIKRGTDVNLLVQDKSKDFEDYYEETPLMLASQKGHLNVVKELIAAGANVNQTLPVYPERCMMPGENATALEMACRPDNMDVVKALAEAGTNAQAIILCASWRGDEDLLRMALQQKPELNFVTGEGGVSPLISAAEHGYENIVKALLEAGADPNYNPENDGETALQAAVAKNHQKIIELLKSYGAKE